jgi:hypothetical protein
MTRFAFCLALLAGGAFLTACSAGEKETVTVTEQVTTTEETESARAETVEEPPSPSDLIASARKGVVQIQTSKCGGQGGGTGFLVDRDLVATAEHVVAGADSIVLKKGGRVVSDDARVIGADSFQDVALIDAGRPLDGQVLEFAQKKPRLGDEVAALGFPLALDFPTFGITVTRGSVSGLNRSVPIDGVERKNLIQTDADINPGNSGGPVISLEHGNVVAIADAYREGSAEFAWGVDSSVAASLLAEWEASPQTVLNSIDCQTGLELTTFSGKYFAIAYPLQWNVEASELSKGTYLDTTIRSPEDPSLMIRVDVLPDPDERDPLAFARQVEVRLKPQPGYQRIELERTDFHSYPAASWEFQVEEKGVLLHKLDIFFVSEYGDVFAVLTQAPAERYDQWSSTFESVREHLVIQPK